jgi:hypothetical protein
LYRDAESEYLDLVPDEENAMQRIHTHGGKVFVLPIHDIMDVDFSLIISGVRHIDI